MDGYELRSRNSIHKNPPGPGAHPSGTNRNSPQLYPTLDPETSPQQETSTGQQHDRRAARPKSARAGQRTSPAPAPGWRQLHDMELSEDEDPVLQRTPSGHSVPTDGRDSSPNRSGRCTPPPSPRRTPDPGVGAAHHDQSPWSAKMTYQPEGMDHPLQADVRMPSKSDPAGSSTAILLAVLVCVAAALCVWWWCSGAQPLPRVGFTDQPTLKAVVGRWRDEVAALSGRFPYQRQRLWKVLRAAVSRMLLETRQPAVVLLLASEAQRDDVRCVLHAAAAAVINATQSPVMPVRVDGATLGALDKQEAKGRLNTELDRLRGGDGVAVFVVEELQQLQPLTAMLLHGYCDNDNAPRKEALFLLSVVTSKTPPGDADVELAVEHALWQAWGQVLGEDIFHALLGRIAGNVAAVTDEGSELLCHKNRP